MPRAGDRYVMPDGLGEYLVVRSNDETGGEYVEMEWVLPPGAGDVASVPVNPDHKFRTRPGQTVRVHNVHHPGGRFDEFVEKQHRLVTSKWFKGLRRPSTAIVMSMAWHEHADLLVPSSRPLRWGMTGLARLGGLLGYRAG